MYRSASNSPILSKVGALFFLTDEIYKLKKHWILEPIKYELSIVVSMCLICSSDLFSGVA